ncbi:MAG TPA: hypothetical protein VGV90_03695 [Solirubrobacteraceae bacterium]|nr:hypothetical protein [Solirubrobacteraceae bacterium]
MSRRRLALLPGVLLLCAAPSSAAGATDETLLRRHAPVLVLDAREPGPPVAVDPFLRGARGARAWAAAPRVYGHAVRDDGRLWLQYWFFYPDNPQDRGIVRSGRHEGDWEMLQVGLGADARPRLVTFAQHSWRQGCGWSQIAHAGPAPVAYVAHASHATYPRRGTHDRPWPDPNDEVRADGLRVRPPVSVIGDERPRWVASRARWGASRAAWWSPAEQSSPAGPRFQDDGRWHAPAAWHADARVCADGPPGYPWWVIAGVGGLLAAFLGWFLRRRASRA